MGRRADHLDAESSKILAGLDDMEDPRMAWAAVRVRIDQLRRKGDSVPDELITAERHLMTEFMAQSQGR